ncbi:Putative RNA polymerase II regulator [Plasmopara halstedii]|uniref:Putative RNA polymerase II regulator n=1 Tax=Plasmopara halstedii TaxID=4781 RepID=A0A0P1B3I0_PLAHL|nr:Putative RNA polymerase II regulator [Plasmopara halstedii]CEG48646.1 Putative RNA polymerase II regulator [Plasmopara halstedii]|eukprot:XP_024585015.1 Putative RNA polymerase II regulator [Plasmopara halstedii]
MTQASEVHGATLAKNSSNGRSHDGTNEEIRKRRAPPGTNATAEERARYELERKKVAKYKEDKLKARRDHTRMILESHAQAKRRALLGKQSEFLATLEFRNTLPDIPFDTKFVKYPHEPERLIKYKPNTLEMDYTYEIHEEPNLGLTIDLIDPAKYEVPMEPEPLEVGDEQILMMKEDHAGSKGRSKVRPTVSWLRRTEYMGNDLYDSVHKFKSEAEIQSALRKGTEMALAEVVSETLEDRAEASFRDINDPATLVHPHSKKQKAVKVWDVFPDQLLSANKYAILSYDMLPSEDIKSKGVTFREERALLCGINKKMQAGNELIQGSILLPNTEEEENTDRKKFSYFREYLMSVESLDSLHIVFMLDPESNQFTYSDVLNRIQLKKTKMSGDDKRRHGAVVHRREYSEAENERRTQILFECGGIYDDQLDDDENVHEFKRQRLGDVLASPNADGDTKTSIPSSDILNVGTTIPVKKDSSNSPVPHNDGSASPVISDSDSE